MSTSEYRPMDRVGRDVDASGYWAARAGSYNAQIDGAYHSHRLHVVDRLLAPVVGPDTVVVDLGCGDGVLTERLAAEGASVIAIDPVEEMVEATRTRLAASGLGGDVLAGGVDGLAGLGDGSVDVLLALNVIAYFTSEEEQRFYAEAARIVRRGGSLVVTHSNELFDLATFNRYTVDFHARHLSGPENAPAIASLLTNPDQPARVTFNIRANPLNYRFVLAEHTFDEVQQEFINLHPVPPLLMDPALLADIDAREYDDTLDWPPEHRWKLLFQCSMFGSRSTRR